MNKVKVYNIPGSNWIYYKIYLGTKSADEVLNDFVTPLTKVLIGNKIIKHWFFIRYNDPKFHLRIRFYCFDKKNYLVMNEMYKLLNPLMEELIIWKIQIDTYNREIERYGEDTMEFSEKIFFYDTVMITSFLENIKDENLRWLFGLKAIDSFLNLFGYLLPEKLDFMEALSLSFKNEIGKSKLLNTNLSDKFRLHRDDINNILEVIDGNEFITEILKNKNVNISKERCFNNLPQHLQISANVFMSSHIHMIMNRLFKSKNTLHETVCYDFLCRYYKSKIAIERKIRDVK